MASEYFTERQRFRQVWLWALLTGLGLLFVWAYIQQIILGKPWGNNPASDTGLLLFSLIPFGIIVLFLVARLETRIDRRGISYRFFPFHRTWREIEWKKINRAYVRRYKPISEFGGWGVRYGLRGGQAYNISGNQGLQLDLFDGKKILLGTQKPEEIAKHLPATDPR
jgi:hypothetical protein